MAFLWRILGLHLLAEVAARLPARYARLASTTLLVVMNLVPLVGVLAGWMTVAEVLFLYCVENAVIGFFAIIRILTALKDPEVTRGQRAGAATIFFLHFGLLAALQLGLTYWLIGLAHEITTSFREDLGVDLADAGEISGRAWLWVLAGLVLSHLVSLVMHWFGREERRAWSIHQCQWAPYPRVLVLQLIYLVDVFILIALLVLVPTVLVVLLVVVKLAVELSFHLGDRRRATKALERAAAAAARRDAVTAP